MDIQRLTQVSTKRKESAHRLVRTDDKLNTKTGIEVMEKFIERVEGGF